MQSFDFKGLFLKFRYPFLILLVGLILITAGVFFAKSGLMNSSTKVEVLQATAEGQLGGEVTAEIAGEVLKPGVYKLPLGSRVEDLLVVSGGFSGNADRSWTEKYLNRAAKLSDGQKVYIPKRESFDSAQDKQSDSLSAKSSGGNQTVSSVLGTQNGSLVNINTSGVSELDSLPGIGPVYAQNIVEHRPYSNVEELLSKGALKQSVYNKVKDLVTVY